MSQEKLSRSFGFAVAGVLHAVATERNMKIHLAAAAAALTLAWRLDVGGPELAVLVLTIAGVLAAELVNTAVEALVDLVSPQYHPLAKAAKDVAAGAVLVMALASLAVGGLLFLPRLLH